MTNCGVLGWISDRSGYRYDALGPETRQPWAPMPAPFLRLGAKAAAQIGFDKFVPDACLINRYGPGARLSLHQDRDELDWSAPIVSVSLGMPAVFLLGGLARADRAMRVPIEHGDVVVWGRADRLRYHGVLPVADGYHALVGGYRVNLSFRRAA